LEGDSNHKGENGRDLLSELLDLEDQEHTQLLEADEKSFAKIPPAESSLITDTGTFSKNIEADFELFDDLNGLTDLIESEDHLKEEAQTLSENDSIPDGNLDRPSEKMQFFSDDLNEATMLEQKDASLAGENLESQLFDTIEPSETSESTMGQFGEREKTVVLGLSEEDLPVGETGANSDEEDPLQAELRKIEEDSDPINSALAGFESLSSPAIQLGAKNLKAEGHAMADSVKELSQDDFADVFATGPIQVSQVKNSQDLNLSGRAWVPYVTIGAAGAFVAAFLTVALVYLRSDSGLVGYRLEGWSLEQAYRAPEPEVVAKFQSTMDATKKALKEDDPRVLKQIALDLDQLVALDARNFEGMMLSLLVYSRLIRWEGPASASVSRFDSVAGAFTAARAKLDDSKWDGERELASVARQWALGDLRAVEKQFAQLDKKYSDRDSYLELKADTLAALGKNDEALKVISGIKMKSKMTLFLEARLSNQDLAIKALADSNYLPARVLHDMNSFSPDGDSAEKLKQLDGLIDQVKDYPQLAALVHEQKAIALANLNDELGARKELELVLKTNPTNVPVILKLANSYEREGAWDKTIEFLRAALRVSPTDRILAVRLIQLMRDRMKVLEALELIETSLAKYPKDHELLFERGLTQLKVFQEEPAKTSLQQALDGKPGFEPAILALASIANRQQDWQEADRLFRSIPEESSNYSLALLGLGQMYFNRYRLEDAQKNFALAIKKDTKNESAYDGLVRLLLRREEDKKAEAIVNEGERALPNSVMVAVAKARILGFQKKYDESFSALKPFLSRFEHDLDFQFARIDLLLDSSQFGEASKSIETLSKREISDPEFSYLKAKLLFLQDVEKGGNREAASRAIVNALRTRPESEKFMLLKARIDLETDDRTQAMAEINKLLNLYPDNSQAYLVRGDAQFEEGNYSAAIDSYTKALLYTRFGSTIFGKLAVLYKATSQPKKAIEFFSKVIVSNPKDAEANLELGKLYVEMARPQKAIEYLQTATELNPKLSEAHYHLGYILKDLGRGKQAVQQFEKYLNRNPDTVEAATVRDEIFFLKQQVIPN